MKRGTMPIGLIKVPKKMESSRPKIYKIMGMKQFYKTRKHFYGSILVDKNCTILDGYVIYYTAKLLGITDVPVTMVSRYDRFKHSIKKYFRKVGK